MSEVAAIFLFYVLPFVVLMFVPTLVAFYWRRDRLFATFVVNLSVLVLGPIGTLLAVGTVVVPKKALECVQERLRAGRIARQPRAWRERECPACRQWMARSSSACPHCHAKVEPLDQACPACRQVMPLAATTCLACGHDQRGEARASGPT